MSLKDREKFISSYHYTLQNHNVWYQSVFRLYLPLGIFSCLLPHRTFHAPLCNVCHRDPTLSIYSIDHWELFENCQIIQLKHRCEIFKGVSYPREMFISTREGNILGVADFPNFLHNRCPSNHSDNVFDMIRHLQPLKETLENWKMWKFQIFKVRQNLWFSCLSDSKRIFGNHYKCQRCNSPVCVTPITLKCHVKNYDTRQERNDR